MVARNRFLADAMFNGNSKISKPEVGNRKYSVPTCHSTLKQLEQARLAKQFEQQRIHAKMLSQNNNNNINAREARKNDEDKPKLFKPRPILERTTSVGKLVNNFENGNFVDEASDPDDEVEDNYDASAVTILTSSTTSPGSLASMTASNMSYPYYTNSKKPPLATKPILRHTVSRDVANFETHCKSSRFGRKMLA